ncbi:eukaryotic aspartyl protease (macronuclear) [Tetrahymena thermophila SB210]|uniref:Eukaryotic aspartyl protease n=1 Tax=Tetrahymena thermophila (strain SB210) TaxID=312017 RepID=Q235D4_TETTS|nr:eukaryotic aspartyl protease [Tetrahymena thermophila SB210]EAR92169.2 eukaryotic aspartyl protease [Tetrahymena thermophila SB210]|eukprot:XP_001012414.2 eukaryotic aspartyl protease [Tetrahymena thermophila SB210]
MNSLKKILAVLCLTLSIIHCGLISPTKPENVISLELKRVQVDPWTKASTISDSACYRDKDSDYVHEYDIQRPDYCKNVKSYVKIMSQCIFMTTAYQVDLKFNTKDATPFKMVLDLRTPWSWIKSPSCKLYERSGKPLDQDCSYPSKVKGVKNDAKFNKTFNCEGNCKVYEDKCAEIDLVQEGLSVLGNFISTSVKLSDTGFKQSVKGFKLVQATGLSGQSLLLGDGVLGLGKQHTGKADDDDEEDSSMNSNYDEDEEEEEEEDSSDDNNSNSKKYTFFEHGTDLWSAIDRVNGKINANVFALYLAEHDSIKPQLLIGSNSAKYVDLIYQPEKHPLKWIPLPILKYDTQEELARTYFQWRIPVRQIVFRYGLVTEKQDDKTEQVVGFQNRTSILLNKETEAQLSLQTSAMILPESMMDNILDKLNQIYGMKCSISTNFLKYVQCFNLDKQLDVSQLAVTIHVGYGIDNEQLINVDPNNLLLGCKKNKNSKYDCYFNFQLSQDDQIIFGDSVMRESFWVFDVNGRKIGLAPAKSNYNEKSFWKDIKGIIADVEDVIRGDIIFLLRFFIVLVILSTILFLFVNWKKIYLIIQRRLRYKNIVDPSELANLDLDKRDMVIKYGQTDDQDITDQIQELEQNESFDAL